jgi:hypothetical protein
MESKDTLVIGGTPPAHVLSEAFKIAGERYNEALAASDPIAIQTAAMSEEELNDWLIDLFKDRPAMLDRIKRALTDEVE